MPRKIQPISGQEYRCIFCSMQRVVFHSTFPSLLARNSLPGSIWGLPKSQLRNSSTPANHYEHFRSRPDIFRRFPKIFRKFKKIIKINHKNIWKLLLNRFRSYQKISEHFRRFPKIFRKLKKIIKTLESTFELFPKFSKRFRRVPKIFQNFHKSFLYKVPQ